MMVYNNMMCIVVDLRMIELRRSVSMVLLPGTIPFRTTLCDISLIIL